MTFRAIRLPLFINSILLCLPIASLQAITIHVPEDQPTIQAGVDAAGSGDTVIIACGTYYESYINVPQMSDFTLIGETVYPGCVAIDGQGNELAPILNIFGLDDTCRIEGIAFVNGAGAALLEDASPRFIRCSFSGNHSNATIVTIASSPTFIDCLFWNNSPRVGTFLLMAVQKCGGCRSKSAAPRHVIIPPGVGRQLLLLSSSSLV